MRKNILASLLVVLFTVGCEDYNDKFDGLDDITRPKNVVKLEYTLTDADYTAISNNSENKKIANEEGDSLALAQLRTNRYFSGNITAEKYVPAYAAAKWYTADNESAVKLTYKRAVDLPENIRGIQQAATYTLSSADYQTVWGSVNADYFTPVKAVKSNLPKILGSSVNDAENGDYLLVSYRYSDKEPGESGELVLTEMNEDFETVENYSTISLEGWSNVSSTGDRKWEGRVYSNNYYAQISQATDVDTDSWLITPKFDLSDASNPAFSFDVTTGNNTGGMLKVLISDDYNGSDPTVATWTDITANFYIPTLPESGYGVLAPAGIMNLSAYQSAPFFIAFRYSCEAGKKGIYQIDNVQVGDVNTVVKTNIAFEDFETLDTEVAKTPVDLPGWSNIGSVKWHGYKYGGNSFPEITAYNMGEVESYLVSPQIAVVAGSYLSFDVNPRFYVGECLAVLISEDFNGDADAASWTDITAQFTLPTVQTNDFVPAGVASLEDYAGKSVSVAFKYTGSQSAGVTTTIRIDNFNVYSLSRGAARMARAAATASYVGTVVDRYALYQYNGSAWNEVDETIAVNPEDYKEMGAPGTNNNFSSSINPDDYLPVFLTMNFPYAQEEDVRTVVYHYYSGGVSIRADQYEYTGGKWIKQDLTVEEVTEQFKRVDSQWMFNPSITIDLLPNASLTDVKEFYQAMVDAAIAKHGERYYYNTRTDCEYYYGSSARYNNFDFRPSAWQTYCAAGPDEYADMTDEALTELMFSRLPEAFPPALEKLYPDADLLESGADVFYVINMAVFQGTTLTYCNYTISFKVVGRGKFEYVEDSLQKI